MRRAKVDEIQQWKDKWSLFIYIKYFSTATSSTPLFSDKSTLKCVSVEPSDHRQIQIQSLVHLKAVRDLSSGTSYRFSKDSFDSNFESRPLKIQPKTNFAMLARIKRKQPGTIFRGKDAVTCDETGDPSCDPATISFPKNSFGKINQ